MVTGISWVPILALPCQVPTSFFSDSSSLGTAFAGMAWSASAAVDSIDSDRTTSERVNMRILQVSWVVVSAGGAGREGFEQAPPTGRRADGLADGLGVLPEAFEVAMLELDARAPGRLGGEPNLDLGDEGGVVLPLGGELPGQHHTVGRVPDQHLADVALGAVFADRVPASADPWFQHGPGHRRLADVVLARPPAVHPGGEHLEGARLRGLDHHL